MIRIDAMPDLVEEFPGARDLGVLDLAELHRGHGTLRLGDEVDVFVARNSLFRLGYRKRMESCLGLGEGGGLFGLADCR
jgi:hypothetical protein